jgi:hypothetical protein
MELEEGVVIFGADALAGSKGLRNPRGLLSEGLRDAEFAGQDLAMENKSGGVGSASSARGMVSFRSSRFEK